MLYSAVWIDLGCIETDEVAAAEFPSFPGTEREGAGMDWKKFLSGAELAQLLNIPPWDVLDEVTLDNRIPPVDRMMGPQAKQPVLARIRQGIYRLGKEIPELKRQWKAVVAENRLRESAAGSLLGGAAPVDPRWHALFTGNLKARLAYQCRYLLALKKAERFLNAGLEPKPGKPDYRTGQWEKAIPVARVLCAKDSLITLQQIKSDAAFQACFRDGMPTDSRIRRKLNENGIKLAGGRR